LFIFLSAQENEPKECAPGVTSPFGETCASCLRQDTPKLARLRRTQTRLRRINSRRVFFGRNPDARPRDNGV